MQLVLLTTIIPTIYPSVSEMLRCLNWPTLHAQGRIRNEQKLIMIFKIVHHLVDIQANSYLTSAATIQGNQLQELILTYNIYSFSPSSLGMPYQIMLLILPTLNNQFKQRIAI